MDRSSTVISIRYPFTLDPFGKNISTVNTSKIYLDRLLTLLSTNVGQRPMLPEYGTDIGYALFENEGNFFSAVNSAILTAVKRWIPQVTVSKVDVTDIGEDGYATVVVTIDLPNATTTTLTINSAIFGTDGQINRAG